HPPGAEQLPVLPAAPVAPLVPLCPSCSPAGALGADIPPVPPAPPAPGPNTFPVFVRVLPARATQARDRPIGVRSHETTCPTTLPLTTIPAGTARATGAAGNRVGIRDHDRIEHVDAERSTAGLAAATTGHRGHSTRTTATTPGAVRIRSIVTAACAATTATAATIGSDPAAVTRRTDPESRRQLPVPGATCSRGAIRYQPRLPGTGRATVALAQSARP